MNSEVRHRRPPRVFAVLLALLDAGYLYGGMSLVAVGGDAWRRQIFRFASRALRPLLVATWRHASSS
jgi:hypothetical protein